MATGLSEIIFSGISNSPNQPVWFVEISTFGSVTTYTLLGSTMPTSDDRLTTEGIVAGQFGFQASIPTPASGQQLGFQVFSGVI